MNAGLIRAISVSLICFWQGRKGLFVDDEFSTLWQGVSSRTPGAGELVPIPFTPHPQRDAPEHLCVAHLNKNLFKGGFLEDMHYSNQMPL